MPVTKTVPNADFLRLVQGRFDEPQANKLMLSIISVVFALVAPVTAAWALIHDAIPMDKWTPDQWTAAGMIPASMILGVWVFWYIGGEYEFTIDSITLRRRGFIVGQMQFNDVTSATYSEDHQGHKWFTLGDGRKKLIVMVFPALASALKEAKQEFANILKDVG